MANIALGLVVAVVVAVTGTVSTAAAESNVQVGPPVLSDGEAFGAMVGHLLGGVEPKTAAVNGACLLTRSPRWRAGQIIVAGVVQAELAEASDLAAAGRLGGVFVLGSPDAGIRDDLARLDDASRIGAGADSLATVDEEGGRVQRLRALLGPLPSARVIAARGTEASQSLIVDHTVLVAEQGFDSMLGPVLDVGGGPAIGDRSYSDDPAVIIEAAGVVIDAMSDAGLVPVLKHFPGHGRASADSHLSLAETPPIEEILASDLEPYEALIDRPGVAVMVGHLDVPGLTAGLPASVSTAAVSGLLRSLLGFDGLVMTDALGMRAVADRHPPPEATVLALDAGVDVVLVDDLATVGPVIDAVAAAVEGGDLDDQRLAEAAARMLAVRGRAGCALPAGGP